MLTYSAIATISIPSIHKTLSTKTSLQAALTRVNMCYDSRGYRVHGRVVGRRVVGTLPLKVTCLFACDTSQK